MPKSQDFFSTLEDMNSGRTLTKIEAKLAELLESVVETEQGGELILKLKVKPWKKNLHKVTATVTTKLPQEAPEEAVFYMDQNNRLVRDDPNQKELFPKGGKLVPGPGNEEAAAS